MPCYDSRDHGSYPVDNPETELRLRLALQRLDKATRAACEMAAWLRRSGGFDLLSESTKSWIVEHELLDKSRIK